MTVLFQFNIDQLPCIVATQILEYLNFEDLHKLERTTKATRNLVASHAYLKYCDPLGAPLRHRNPLARGFHATHSAWGEMNYLVSPGYPHGLQAYVRSGPLFHPFPFLDTNLPSTSAVYPYIPKLKIHVVYRNCDDDPFKGLKDRSLGTIEVIGTGKGEYVTFVDIVQAIRDRLGNVLDAAWERWKGDDLGSKESLFDYASVYFEEMGRREYIPICLPRISQINRRCFVNALPVC
jgi:hypothetical protein